MAVVKGIEEMNGRKTCSHAELLSLLAWAPVIARGRVILDSDAQFKVSEKGDLYEVRQLDGVRWLYPWPDGSPTCEDENGETNEIISLLLRCCSEVGGV